MDKVGNMMSSDNQRTDALFQEIKQLRRELKEANDILYAIRHGEVDALLVEQKDGDKVYVLNGADHIYRILVEEMQEGYVTIAHDGTILFCNKNFAEIVRTSLEQVIGSSIYSFLKPADWKKFTCLLAECKGSFKTEFKLKASDEFFVPVLLSANNVSIGRDTFACLVITDLTEQKRSERFIRMIFNRAREAIIACDKCGRIVQVNPAATKLFGDCLLGNDFNTAITLLSKDDGSRYLLHQIIAGDPSHGIELNYLLREGQLLNLLVTAGRLSDEEADSYFGYVVNIKDITENQKFTQEITRLERLNLVGEMAAGIGHEVRNPMTTVRGYLQLFREKTQFIVYREDFDIMIEELDRANNIISDFLSIAKRKTVKFQPTDLNAVIENIFPLIQADAYRRGSTIELDLTQIPHVSADGKEICQCLLNLVRNGLEAMTNGGTVTIRTWQAADRIMLSIKDQGPGIPDHVREKLGTPFFTTKEQGTGLGLSVCFSIAERHKAKIEIETNPTGTTFLLIFTQLI